MDFLDRDKPKARSIAVKPQPANLLLRWVLAVLSIIAAVLIVMFLVFLLVKGLDRAGIGFGISSDIARYNRLDDQLVSDLYAEAANRVDAGEIKNLVDFEDWKKLQEKDGPRDASYNKLFLPHLDKVQAHDVDPAELSKVLRAISKGYQQ